MRVPRTLAAARRDGAKTTRGLMALGLLAVLCGCQGLTTQATPTPAERLELESRALNLLLAASESELDVIACNAIESLVRVAPEYGLPAYRRARRSSSPLVRYAGYVALGEVRERGSLSAIVAGVRDPDPRVRLAAAFAACRCGKDGYARLLVRGLTDLPDENLRADAAWLIGCLEEPRAEKWLRAALRFPANQKSNRVTLHINWALAMLGQADAVQQLILFAQGDTVTRIDALLILAELGDSEACDILRYFLDPSEDYLEARLVAARGLGRLGMRDGYELATRMMTFTDPDPNAEDRDRTMRVRSLAAHALGEIGDPRALGSLRQTAADPADQRLQVAAAYAICRITGR